jgi:hypothetical protein
MLLDCLYASLFDNGEKYLMMETGGDSDEVAKSFTEFFHFIYNLLCKHPYFGK